MTLRPTTHNDQPGTLWVAGLVSVLLHVPLLYALGAIDMEPEPYEAKSVAPGQPLSLTLMERRVEKEKKKPEKKEDEDPVQYVAMEAPEVEETPKEAKLADQFASKAEVQMVKRALPGASALLNPTPQARQPSKKPPIPDAKTPARNDNPIEKKQNVPAPQDNGQEVAKSTSEMIDLKRRTAAPDNGGQINPQSLFPNLQNSEIINPIGKNGSMDYLRDVDEGDKTLLNRKRSRYWAFFDRVKVEISKEWSPATEYKRRDPYGNVYGVKDRYSAVRVTLNGDGTVRQLYVNRPSGLDFYDAEAVRSIRAAAPFHNTPEGLKDEDGLIHFTFGFYFEISSGTSLRIFN